MNIADYIKQIEQQRKEQDAIYHNVAMKYNLSDTAMWVLYVVSDLDNVYTQQELCKQCFFAKQTIHTAVKNLVDSGLAALEVVPGTRNQKKILLTDSGMKIADKTVELLKKAENRAYAILSDEELKAYLEMTARLTTALRDETDKL